MKNKYYLIAAGILLFIAILITILIWVSPTDLFGPQQSSVHTEKTPLSKRLTASPSPTPSPTPPAFIIENNWRYFKGSQEPPDDWNQPGFNDSDWQIGEPGFGFGDRDDKTVLEDMRGNYLSLYLRNRFSIRDLKGLSPLILTVEHDDGFVAYLNGVEICRKYIKGEPPTHNKKATKNVETGTPRRYYLDPDLLLPGENVIAFQVHNKSIDNSDLSLIPELRENSLPIELGYHWRYWKGKKEPHADWNEIDFDDTNWSLGKSGFGFADGDDATQLRDMRGKYLSLYTRYVFNVDNPNRLGFLSLGVDYDDGFVAYLNGAEVWRRNLSGSPPQYNTPADVKHESGTPEYFNIKPSLLNSGKNVLAIQIHNQSLNSSDLSLKPTLKQTGPYLQNVTPESIVIKWESHGNPSQGRVRYRIAEDLIWKEVSSTEPKEFIEVLLTDLNPGTTYQYQVSQTNSQNWIPGIPAAFSTVPDPSSSYRIAVYGDSRTDITQHTEVVQSIQNTNPDIILHTGDMVDAGMERNNWGEQFFGPLAEVIIRKPLYPALGNHEYDGDEKMWYFDLFSLPGNEQWYAFNYGCSRIIMLNSNIDFEPDSPQHKWLVEELNSSQYNQSQWRIVVIHHPPYTSGPHKSSEQPVVNHLVPLFEKHGVDLVAAGHNHHYERSQRNGIVYLVSGGGGGELYDFPHQDLNPHSQVRSSSYHHLTLDFSCGEGTLEINAWNKYSHLIDGPIKIEK